VPALSFDLEPPLANERTTVPIGGAEKLKHRSQTLVRKIGDVVGSSIGYDVNAAVFAVAFAGGVGITDHRRNRGCGSGLGDVDRAVALVPLATTSDSGGGGRRLAHPRQLGKDQRNKRLRLKGLTVTIVDSSTTELTHH